MYKELLVAFAMSMSFSGSAFALGDTTNNNQANAQAQGGNVKQGQHQGQLQGQLQGQIQDTKVGNGSGNFSPNADAKAYGGDAKAYGGNADANSSSSSDSVSKSGAVAGAVSDSGGNTQNLVQNVAAPNLRDLAPGISMGSLYPSAPCMGTSAVGGSGPGFSVSIGSSWTSEECQLRETARMAPTPADAVFVWCKTAAAAGAPSCVKAASAKTAEVTAEAKEKASTSPASVKAPLAQVSSHNTDTATSKQAANNSPWADSDSFSSWN